MSIASTSDPEAAAGAVPGFDAFDSIRASLLQAALDRAPFEGWSALILPRAAAAAGVTDSAMHAAFPAGVADLLRYWSQTADEAVRLAFSGGAPVPARIRDKVAHALEVRIAAVRPHREAARRAAATLALPHQGTLGPELIWRTADAIWRALGDPSTDFNFYSKRAILAGVWSSTFLHWLSDETADEAPTRAFLTARIEDVMRIEKAKADMRRLGVDFTAPLKVLARIRYGEADPLRRRSA